MDHYDAIIIGSGQAGTPLSKKLAKHGWKTALVEKQYIGGTCVNVGCTPTKTMIASARAAYDIARAGELGVEVSSYSIDMPHIIQRKNDVVKKFNEGSQKGLEATDGLDILFGEASFRDKHSIEVAMNDGSKRSLSADHIFINAGARPSIPSIKGLEEIDYFTSDNIMDCESIPDHLLIIGGAYIGLEFGQMYRRFGSEVTVLEYGDRFLGREDEDIAKAIQDILTEEGIAIHTNAKTVSFEKKADTIHASVTINDKASSIACSHVLLATGRQPNSDTLNLSAAGIETTEEGYIKVNDLLETNVAGIYALGDIKGGPEFTHISYNDHLVVFNNITNKTKEDICKRMVPYCMFTDPQLGRIGITEAMAKEQQLNYKVASIPMKNVARAIETGDTRGLMKAVVDADSGQILGAAILGREGGEVMTVLQMAMLGKITWQQISELPIAHPLYAESLNNLFMELA